MRVIVMVLFGLLLFSIFGCSERTLVLKDRLQNDTYYLDLRPNVTHQKGDGQVSKMLNFTDGSDNLTFYEDMRE
jgi:hypothetical protein